MTSTGDGLAARIVPPRGAAQKATASIAEQLSDSPGRSESSSPSNPFREPAQRTKSVKYRYTATGKHLSSPLKGSPSSPERKPDRPKKSRLAILTPAPPKGNAPAAATTPRKRKASLRREDVLFDSSPSPLSSVPTSPIAPPADLPPTPTPTPAVPKRLSVSQTLPLHAFESKSSTLGVFSQPLSPKRKQKKTKTHPQKATHAWDIGNSIWVLVNQAGMLADRGAQSRSDLMWWPAQVVQNQPLRVSLFGDYPSSSATNRGLCTIFSPSSSNVQSIHDDSGAKRFSRTTFCLTALHADDDTGPPTKKQRLDDVASVEERWESAVQCMDKASTLEKDGLPALLSSYATAGGAFYDSLDDSDPDMSGLRQAHKRTASASKQPKEAGSTRKSRPHAKKHDRGESTSRHCSPCPPDPTIQIPGELVLALAPRTGGSYWPGQILRHVPDVKERYLIKFLDDEEHVVTRDRFWTSEEEGFVRCTLGEWESAVKTMEDPDSEDDGDGDRADDATLDDAVLPSPPPAKDFEDLSVRAQLAYVKPVLRAILNKEYAPARERHEAFMRGGSGRAALLKSAGVRGGMDARFVKAVQKAICEWVLGDCGGRPEKLDIVAEAEGSATVEVTSQEVVPGEILPQGDKMEGIEGPVIPEFGRADENDNGALPPTTPNKQVADMAIDGHEQASVSLPPPANGVILSPAITQAALAPKSQLDLLAEVSQAVATEPSLLPSHPELPRLKTLLDLPCQDTASQPSPLTPVPEEEQPPQGPTVCEEFEALSGIEKLDYCLNILLPESIQQLILWRSGERTSSVLFSPEEEQRLHDVGVRKAAETDWVDDVMRLRAAQARLWGIDVNKKTEKAEVVQGGTRSRPRPGTVSRP